MGTILLKGGLYMREKLCLIVPEGLRAETEALLEELEVEEELELQVYPGKESEWKALIEGTERNKGEDSGSGHEEFLLLCCGKGPEIPEKYRERIKVHSLGQLSEAVLGPSAVQRYYQEGICVLLPAQLHALLEGKKTGTEVPDLKGVHLEPTAILLADTGLYPDINEKIQEFSSAFNIPCRRKETDLDYFKLYLKNLLHFQNHEKLRTREKKAVEKSAYYAMTFELLRELMHAENEKEAVKGITEVFNMLFAPGEVTYFSIKEREILEQGQEQEQKGETGSDKKPGVEGRSAFLKAEAEYLINEAEDGFTLKLRNNGETLGIIELKNILFPEYINQYLNLAVDIASVCGLVISNSRRYSEIISSRKQLAQHADVLKIINSILRHDINNELNSVNMALDLYQEIHEEKYLAMAQKAIIRGAETIRKMEELENLISKGKSLSSWDIHQVAEKLVKNYPIKARVEGSCRALADEAFPPVIDNIIRNAIVHGKTEQIDIFITEEKKHCIIRIADYGSGIPDSVKAKIFEKGFKFGDTGNTGLGLYIVKKVIERYGGVISVEDNMPKGTVFIIKLKCAPKKMKKKWKGFEK